MDPKKLAQYTQANVITSEAEKYLRHVVDEEMPTGLKKYLEVEMFPRIGLKVGRSITLQTARNWLHHYGWKYMQHKKALYYDGHDRPDVVAYRQNVFLPKMLNHQSRLVEYQVGNLEQRVEKPLMAAGPEGHWLVLCAHDESTVQANDGMKSSWVLEGEQPIRKKGAGRGIHQSDVICSTVGWLEEASQSLEYGKNYEGYWNGELFVKQASLLNGWNTLANSNLMIYSAQRKDYPCIREKTSKRTVSSLILN